MLTNSARQAIELFNRYITAWNHRDSDLIRYMMTPEVFLTDWEISVQGRDSVVAANGDIWINVPDIIIHVDDIFYCEHNDTVIGKLTVQSKKQEFKINVIDIVKFKQGKIFSVEAYKQ